MNYTEAISLLPMGKRILGLFMILLFGTGVALGTVYIKQRDCDQCSGCPFWVKAYNNLAEIKANDDQQCEEDKQRMLANQAKMQEIYGDLIELKRMAKKMKPDTVVVNSRYAMASEVKIGETLPAMKGVQPVTKSNKSKDAVLNKIDEIQATIKE